MFVWEKDQCLCNSLLNFCVDCVREVVGQKWREAEGGEKDNQRWNLISSVMCRHTGMQCTHQYAVTKASQIGNSFSRFRFNDHRGNVNVSGVAGTSLYSQLASIFTIREGTRREGDRRLCDMLFTGIKSDERQRHCRLPTTERNLYPGPVSSMLKRTGNTMPAASHLHLNGLLCTDNSEMSVCGGLASLPWQKPSCAHCSREMQLRGSRVSTNHRVHCIWVSLVPSG